MIENLPRSYRWERVASLTSRVFVWSSFFFVLYLLRSFSLLIFLTFVFSYLQLHATEALARFVKNRSLRVVLIGILFLGILTSVGLFCIPQVAKEAKHFGDNTSKYMAALDEAVYGLAEEYPLLDQLLKDAPESSTGFPGVSEQEVLSSGSPLALEYIPGTPESLPSPVGQPKDSVVSLYVLQQILGLDFDLHGQDTLSQAVELIRGIGRQLLALGSAFFLALLFSFLIVLDLPRLTSSVQKLTTTKLSFVYEEVAESIYMFSKVLGRALEAQLVIAFANTILTAILIVFLGLEGKLFFLSLIVFLCGFIPVVGVFLSSIPISLLAFEHGGLEKVLFAALAIWGIHLIEAYILNPKIYGYRFHINPVLVLIILTIGGKLFGVWGLLLGVPVCTYFFGYAIQNRSNEVSVDGVAES